MSFAFLYTMQAVHPALPPVILAPWMGCPSGGGSLHAKRFKPQKGRNSKLGCWSDSVCAFFTSGVGWGGGWGMQVPYQGVGAVLCIVAFPFLTVPGHKEEARDEGHILEFLATSQLAFLHGLHSVGRAYKFCSSPPGTLVSLVVRTFSPKVLESAAFCPQRSCCILLPQRSGKSFQIILSATGLEKCLKSDA